MFGRSATSVIHIVLAHLLGCSPRELPVVAEGRFVRLATDRDDTICGGTIAFLDATVEATYQFLGETPPDEQFIRYEWLEDPEEHESLSGRGWTRGVDDGILIRTDQLIHEHELVHAVHQSAWPASARFLHEGLAIQLDSRRVYNQERWPDDLPLDEVLEGELREGHHYTWAWFLVSQILRDHGVDGLHAMFEAVAPGATAAEVRDAYSSLFGRPIDVLLEPTDSPYGVDADAPRVPCLLSLCPSPAVPFEEPGFSAAGPTACADDPNAIGPHSRNQFVDGPPVWRETIMDADTATFLVTQQTLALTFQPCFLDCRELGSTRPVVFPGTEWKFGFPAGQWRIEARRPLEELPTDDPGALEFVSQRP